MKLSEKAAKIKPSSTLALNAMCKKMQAEGRDLASFTAGEPDFDTPKNIKDAAVLAINQGFTKYTDASGAQELRQAIAEKYRSAGLNYDFSQIVVSNGGKHALTNIFLAILNDGDEVIIPAPFWLSYPEIVRLAGGVPVIVNTKKENGFKVTREELEAAYSPKTKAIVVNSPSNPVGSVYSEAELRVVADFCIEKDLLAVSDEIYERLIYNGSPHVSIAFFNDMFARTVVCSGHSKTYSMTGWRIGYTASSPEIAKLIGNIQSHSASNPCSIAQKAAYEALVGPQESVEEMRRAFMARRDYICDRIDKAPLISCIKPEGAFYAFVDVSALFGKTVGSKELKTAADLCEVLLSEASVVCVPGDDFGAPSYIRLSYATSTENIKKGMDMIEEFIISNYGEE